MMRQALMPLVDPKYARQQNQCRNQIKDIKDNKEKEYKNLFYELHHFTELHPRFKVNFWI